MFYMRSGARRRQQHSTLSRGLDSLADVVSFGVGPATLGIAAGLRGGWDALVLAGFVCCGVSRLARYNGPVLKARRFRRAWC